MIRDFIFEEGSYGSFCGAGAGCVGCSQWLLFKEQDDAVKAMDNMVAIPASLPE